MTKTTFKQKIALLLLGFILTVIIIEATLRLCGFIYLSVQSHRNRASLKQEGYRILCLGDSHTALRRRRFIPISVAANFKSEKKRFKIQRNKQRYTRY